MLLHDSEHLLLLRNATGLRHSGFRIHRLEDNHVAHAIMLHEIPGQLDLLTGQEAQPK
jgi:hypothetical protein